MKYCNSSSQFEEGCLRALSYIPTQWLDQMIHHHDHHHDHDDHHTYKMFSAILCVSQAKALLCSKVCWRTQNIKQSCSGTMCWVPCRKSWVTWFIYLYSRYSKPFAKWTFGIPMKCKHYIFRIQYVSKSPNMIKLDCIWKTNQSMKKLQRPLWSSFRGMQVSGF